MAIDPYSLVDPPAIFYHFNPGLILQPIFIKSLKKFSSILYLFFISLSFLHVCVCGVLPLTPKSPTQVALSALLRAFW